MKLPASLTRGMFLIIVISFVGIPIFSLLNNSTETTVSAINPPVSLAEPAVEKIEMPPTIQETYPEFSSIPVGYLGQNFADLYNNIDRALGRKTKYKSTADYEAERKQGIEENPLLFKGYITLHDTGLLGIDYDADTKKLYIEYPKSISDSETYDLGAYVGSNAFGVSKAVKKTSRNVYRVELQNKYQKKKTSISMAPEIAEQHGSYLDFMYVIQLVAPYIEPFTSDDSEYHKPTIDDPEERFVKWHTMKAKLSGLIVYNTKTGEIVFQERLTD